MRNRESRSESSNHARFGAPRIGHPWRGNKMVDHEAVESEVRVMTHLRNSLSIASAGRGGSETFPKPATYCHPPPFRRRKTARYVSISSIVPCPSRASRPAWVLAFRTASGAERSRLDVAIERDLCHIWRIDGKGRPRQRA